jgi:hypothetical protein
MFVNLNAQVSQLKDLEDMSPLFLPNPLTRATAESKWELKSCVGEKQGEIQNGKYSCWRPIGVIKDVWNDLRPKIKEFLDHCGGCMPLVMLELYMIGRTEEKARPTILICSDDKKARKRLRKAIRGSGLLTEGFDLGDTSVLPDHRRIQLVMDPSHIAEFASQKYFDKLKNLSEQKDERISKEQEIIVGRKLIFRCAAGELFATGGPILYMNGKAYQLTVCHVYEIHEPISQMEEEALSDDCSFDGQTDDEAESLGESLLLGGSGASWGSQSSETQSLLHNDSTIPARVKQPPTSISPISDGTHLPALESWDQGRDASADPSSPSGIESLSEATRILRLSPPSLSAATRTHIVEARNLFLGSAGRPSCPLDYALIELTGQHPWQNRIIHKEVRDRRPVSRLLEISHISSMGTKDTNVLAVTPAGILGGRLSSTASVIHIPGKSSFQDVYAVYLDGVVRTGDCGSAVVDYRYGSFYGHIAGSPGATVAYVLPAKDVLGDIEERTGSWPQLKASTIVGEVSNPPLVGSAS